MKNSMRSRPRTVPVPAFDPKALELIAGAGSTRCPAPKEIGGADLPLAEADGGLGRTRLRRRFDRMVLVRAETPFSPTSAPTCPTRASTSCWRTTTDGSLPVCGGQFAPNGTAELRGRPLGARRRLPVRLGDPARRVRRRRVLREPPGRRCASTGWASCRSRTSNPRGNWDVLGLSATQSIDYGVRGASVPEVCAFDFFAPTVHRGSAKHYLGVIPMTAAGHAGWALGWRAGCSTS